ncbi:hypothetical protein M3204_14095 [Mesobacillus subterraneus]|uniref:hypothetical protein n=1 Tax=Mesobacillus subterraneus TaxID=285983 RepID=UPI00203C0004|nr:hypothetical protein [Mesobacillus subterraneus]MCM3665545.1 hypothetical protein [Mesobacillus subterraneus]MCM3686104.1 hypothetical protein [Mesobacillus subterraneus]
MNKERLMQFLSDAIDSGAYLHIHMTQFEGENYRPVSREEAEERAKRFASIIGEPIEESNYGDPAETFSVGSTATNGIRGDFTYLVKKPVTT